MLVQLQLYTLAELERKCGPLRHIEGPFGGGYLRLLGADETMTYGDAYNEMGEIVNAIKINNHYFRNGHEIPKVFIKSAENIGNLEPPQAEETCFKAISMITLALGIDDEPLDGDAAEDLAIYLKAVINRNEGNITEEEFRDKVRGYYNDYEVYPDKKRRVKYYREYRAHQIRRK